MSYLTSIDISNRALDHCGQDPIDATLGFTEPSKKARLAGRIYDKLRQAELRRNVWRFAIRRVILRALDTNTMLLTPALWSSTTTYFAGSIVADGGGQFWVSNVPNNLNQQPENYPTQWSEYFGPLSVMLYSSTTTYNAGELVYTTAGDGTNRTYISLQNSNSDNPATATAWSATAVYSKNQVITYSAVAYMSKIDFNTAQTPSSSAADWAVGTTYAINNLVNGSDGVTYQSLGNGNVGFDPVSDAGVHWQNTGVLTPWTTVFTGGTGSLKWLQIGGAEFPFGVGLSTINIIYPIGAGPSSQSTTHNVFRLPGGFLRQAPTDPKAGANSYLGASWGLSYKDWLFEGNYIVTTDVDPQVLRFVADTTDVANMDPMFCEGLAARMGLEMCEPLTQSSDKVKTIADFYNKMMGDARIVNGIETGVEQPPVDDYISARN